VSAPTSSGKTVVADYCNFRARREGTKVIYTTPLKALSNQKFRDFQREFGEEHVGLVTGENTINDEAPIVVMTTEILRNVIYEDLPRLDPVGYVILDEVHYIDDFPRGSVWEEVIIQAPSHIKLVGLSATIGNYGELARWMSENRGPVATVFHEERPTELRLWLAMRNRLHALFGPDGGIDQQTWSRAVEEEEASFRVRGFRRLPSNDMLRVIGELRRMDMVPAIYFIFSRRGCREALQRCAFHEFDLTTDREKRAIDQLAGERLRSLTDPDEAALFKQMVDADMLRRGLAVHHAGLLPYHKELVEELFQAGLIKVVFATETLSLGINMPARAVVVSSFTKFDGVNFATLTTGELTQLMGRAGRRGIDAIGHGVILKEADVEIGTIYEVAMGEGLIVESRFLPSYNMALNLLRLYTPEQADDLMARSFGQFQKRLAADHTVDRLENIRARLRDLDVTWDCTRCRPEDVSEYFRLEDQRKLRRLCRILAETGFLADDKPTDKGLLAARVYGENTLLVTEAVWNGWLDGLRPADLCAALAMLATEDRGRDRGPRQVRRYPTPAVGQTARLLRALYFRFADLEQDLDEPNLRPPSYDYIDFAHRWASGQAMDAIPLPPNVDIGDAIKAMKGLYSMLRQLEFALRHARHPLHGAIRDAVLSMERDVIRRT
jgi:ATP-dependent RNA helicase HelY